jgi:multiple sugar transport system substrate-binding protein
MRAADRASVGRYARGALAAAGFLCALSSCAPREDASTVDFWAFGREGEVVASMVPDFEKANPGLHVRVQQIPWTAAHEKLLTSFVGEATPDIAQLGNTWIPEFAALGALEPLEPLVSRSTQLAQRDYSPGIWATNVVDGVLYGVPWYVDTRAMFYRTDLLKRAGFDHPPQSWDEWRQALTRVKSLGEPTEYGILLPLDEWAQPVILGLQEGAPLLKDGGRYGDFEDPRFRTAFEFYVSLFRTGLAPAVANTQISNLYQEFARGRFAFYISGPWNIGEFKRRIPANEQNDWNTAPLPGPTGAASGVSMAGGSSFVIFKGSQRKAAAWRFIEFLSQPAQQAKFYELTGDLPARNEAWRFPILANDPKAHAFEEQLTRVVPLPQVPEWEQIAQRVAQYAEQAGRGNMSTDAALAALDRDVNDMLAKRRAVLARQAEQRSGR